MIKCVAEMDTQAHYIYRATAPCGKAYIGYTNNLEKRVRAHKQDARLGNDTYFHRAIRKHGADAFKWQLLAVVQGAEQAKQLEVKLIAKLKTKSPHGYNTTSGGDGVAGFKHTPEARARMSVVHKEAQNRPEVKARKSAALTGQTRSAEQRARMSVGQRGHSVSAGTRAKISAANLGRRLTAEQRARMSAAQKGKPKSPEAVEKTAAANRGRKHTEQARANMRAGWVKRKRNAVQQRAGVC